MSIAVTIRKTLARLAAFWQIWQPNGPAAENPPSLPNPVVERTGQDDRLPFDPQDCEELGVFTAITQKP